MTVLIDADGCPVVNITIKLARRYQADCLIVCDTSHRFECDGAQTLIVSKGADSADFAIVNRVAPGDIVVTQDYGLAAICLARGGVPIRQDGLVYTSENIGPLLQERHTAREIRMSGGRQRKIQKRTAKQDEAFEKALRNLLDSAVAAD